MAGIKINNNVLNQLHTPAIVQDIVANRPNPSWNGRLFVDTTNNIIQRDDGTTWITVSGSPTGSVSLVGLSMPSSIYNVANSPITTSGTIAVSFKNQSQNLVLASPDGLTGQPSFRSLVANDIPDLSGKYIQNQNSIYQTADFSITGSGLMRGSMTCYEGIYCTPLNGKVNLMLGGGEISAGEGVLISFTTDSRGAIFNFGNESAILGTAYSDKIFIDNQYAGLFLNGINFQNVIIGHDTDNGIDALQVQGSINATANIQTGAGNNFLNFVSNNTNIGWITDQGYKLAVNGATASNGGGWFSGVVASALNLSKVSLISTMNSTVAGSETNQYAIAAIYGGLAFSNTSTFTPAVNAKHASLSATIVKSNAGTYSGIMPAIFACSEFSGSGNVTTVAAFKAYVPRQQSGQPAYTGTITNAVGIYIDDISTGSDIAAHITNKYGIYQAGGSDKNFFNGEIQLGSGQTVSPSVTNIITNKVKMTINGTDYYLLASTSNA